MIPRVLQRLCLALFLVLGLAAASPAAEPVRLVVFNPTVHNIRCLEALRAQNILAVPNLVVVGIYHRKQTEDFKAAAALVREKNYAWMTFHEVTADLGPSDVFRANACTPEFERILKTANGVIFFGGSDIPPALYGQKAELLTEVDDPYRNYLELSAIFHLLGAGPAKGGSPLLEHRPSLPILGICLGFQSLNVGTGGTLVQDIPTGIYGVSKVEDVIALGADQWHNNPYRRLNPLDRLMGYNFHPIQLKGESLLTAKMGLNSSDHPRVLSSHHQALGRLGANWTVAATSLDGKVVEAIQHSRYPNVLGIQFHPEHYLLWDASLRTRQNPTDAPTSYHAILAATPPSLAFNKAIWAWFGQQLLANPAP